MIHFYSHGQTYGLSVLKQYCVQNFNELLCSSAEDLCGIPSKVP